MTCDTFAFVCLGRIELLVVSAGSRGSNAYDRERYCDDTQCEYFQSHTILSPCQKCHAKISFGALFLNEIIFPKDWDRGATFDRKTLVICTGGLTFSAVNSKW